MSDVIKKNIEIYIESILNCEKFTDCNIDDHGEYNRSFDRAAQAEKTLSNLGQEGKAAIGKLMEHDEPYVRYWAALFCLGCYEEKAIIVLNELKSIKKVGSNSRKMLREWSRMQRKPQWHYLVEPTPKNIMKYGTKSLHNIYIIMKVPKNIHIRIARHYSSKKQDGMTIGKWIESKSFLGQYFYGVKTWIKALNNRL